MTNPAISYYRDGAKEREGKEEMKYKKRRDNKKETTRNGHIENTCAKARATRPRVIRVVC
jgi:hypothetical protein